MANKVIFLDIDGPLMPGRQWFDSRNSNMRKNLGDVWWKKINELEEFDELITFDPVAVQFFNLWQRLSGAKIVVASNWAQWISQDRLLKIFEVNGLSTDLHEDWRTERTRFDDSRMHQIGDWMYDHSEYTGIIVDDDIDLCGRFNSSNVQRKNQTKSSQIGWQDKLTLVAVEYTNGLTLQNFKDGCTGLEITQDAVMQKVFGIEPLTEEQKKQAEEDLELLVRCCI